MDWQEMFGISRPIGETLLRGSVTFLMLMTMMRVTGKRESGGLALTDLLVVVLVAQASGNALTGDYKGIADGMLLVATILGWSVALDALAFRSRRLRRLLKSRPTPLIRDGRVNEKALLREFMHREELEEELRLHGVFDISNVARAYLEPNGMISILRKAPPEESTPSRPPVP